MATTGDSGARRAPGGGAPCRGRLLAALFLLGAVSCGGTTRTIRPTPTAPLVVREEVARLTLPPDAGSTQAVARLAAAPPRDLDAAWALLHYLIDLYDHARFTQDEAARRLLFDATGVEPGRGSEPTDRVLDALLVRVDAIAQADRLHEGAEDARALLDLDRVPPGSRRDLFARMAVLKEIGRRDGPLAANAQLRLFAFCHQAFRDAARAAPANRHGVLSFCLYPLWDSDPEPYFATRPGERPPPPDWEELAAANLRLLERMPGRLAPLGKLLEERERAFVTDVSAVLPSPPDAAALGLPRVDHAEAYAWTPLVELGDGSGGVAPEKLQERIGGPVATDGRARLAVALDARAPASVLLATARVAQAVGATTLELAVAYEQQLKVPAGDYWEGRLQGDRVLRAGVLPLALDPLGGGSTAAVSRTAPRAEGYDPTKAQLRLHLVVEPGRWQLVAPGGAFPAVGDARGLRELLGRIERAYPDEDGLVLVPGSGVRIGELVAAAHAASYGGAGEPLFASLALGTVAPAVDGNGKSKGKGKGKLVDSVNRRARADVKVLPEELALLAPAVRRCYLDALERDPRTRGELVLERRPESDGSPGIAVTAGPADEQLRACVISHVGAAIKDGRARNVRVELRP